MEVLVSLAIVGFLLLTLIHSAQFHLGLVERQWTVTESVLLAQSKLDEMVRSPRSHRGTFPEPHEAYSYETEIRDALFPGLLEIAVTVTRADESTRLSQLIRRKS